jgi:hypothetical protein
LCLSGALLHVVFVIAARSRAKVFVSYEHQQNKVADLIASQLQRRSFEIFKLPFVDTPNHDSLLDEVRNSIVYSDLILCVPGRQSSFVENEIAMAFALNKPMLFILSESNTAFLPNTAKKGYPLFDREQVEADQCATLADFCSYLVGMLIF